MLLVLPVIPWPLRRNGIALRFAPILEYLARTWRIDVLVLSTEAEAIPSDWPPQLCRSLSVVQMQVSAQTSPWKKLKTAITGLWPWGIPFGCFPHVSRLEIQSAVARQIESGNYSAVIWGVADFLDVVCKIRRQAPRIRFVVDFVDSPALTVSRAQIDGAILRCLRFYTTWRLRRLEREVHRRCDASIYISPVDAAAARPREKRRIHVIPNGVSTPKAPSNEAHESDHPIIGFVGDMSYVPNVSAVLRLANLIFPRVRQTCGNAELLIIGRNPAPEIQRLRSSAVTVTGEVRDIWEFISRVTVFCFPMTEGAGLQNKILEAMYAGIPAVVTPLAARSLEAIHEKHLLIADSDEEIATQLLRLLSDPAFSATLAAQAAEFVAQRFSWSSILPRYEAILMQALEMPGSRSVAASH